MAPTAALLRHVEVDRPPPFHDLVQSRRLGAPARSGPAPPRRRRAHRRLPRRPRHRPRQGQKWGRKHRSEPRGPRQAGSKMHVLSDANGLPLLVGVSAGNTHDSEGLKPMIEGHQTRHDPHHGRYFKPQRLHADKAYDRADLRTWLRGKRIGVRIARKGGTLQQLQKLS
ncbi:transposase [Streptomyces anthocyanicus]|uniref:transposase n=1 Tax=Streptomyces anthocyanicus TaxID=68174 RepID=UPI00386E4FA7